MKSFTQNRSQLEELLELLEKDSENIKRVLNTTKSLEAEFEIHAKAETVNDSVKHSPLEKNRIIKTLLFKCGENFAAVMCPGDKRVDEEKLSELTGEEVRMAYPREVKKRTGYVVGGVSPFDLEVKLYACKSIPQGEIRPAAGSRVIGIKTSREKLFNLLEPEIVELAK